MENPVQHDDISAERAIAEILNKVSPPLDRLLAAKLMLSRIRYNEKTQKFSAASDGPNPRFTENEAKEICEDIKMRATLPDGEDEAHSNPQTTTLPMTISDLPKTYIDSAMARAVFEEMEDGEGWCATIPGFAGVLAIKETRDGLEQELRSDLEGWIQLGLERGHKLPEIDSLDPRS